MGRASPVEIVLESYCITACLSHLFQVAVSGQQQAFHIASKKKHLGQSTQNAQWGAECEVIDHERPIALWEKFVNVGNFLENASGHFIGKARGAFVGGNFRGQMLLDAEMHSFPGHGIAELHHA